MMKLEDKINLEFKDWKLKLSKNDRPIYLRHFYTDFIELMALFSNGSYISDSDAFERFKTEEIIKYNDDSDKDEKTNMDEDSDRSNKTDKHWELISDVFTLAETRQLVYGDSYPFRCKYEYEGYSITLKENLTDINKLYINLLLCSNLDSFPGFKDILSKEFEMISKIVVKSLFKDWDVRSTGKIPDITGSAIDKINQLSVLFDAGINRRFVNEDEIKGNQEYGLDLVAWKKFNDSLPNFPIYLFQCTCEKAWGKKTNDTQPYQDFYDYLKIYPNHSLFIPYSVIDNDKSIFFGINKIKNPNILIFERQRILSFFDDMNLFKTLDSFDIVEKSILFQEKLA